MTPANANRIEITLSDDRLAALDAARGYEPRASFIKRALESALSASETREAQREALRSAYASLTDLREAIRHDHPDLAADMAERAATAAYAALNAEPRPKGKAKR